GRLSNLRAPRPARLPHPKPTTINPKDSRYERGTTGRQVTIIDLLDEAVSRRIRGQIDLAVGGLSQGGRQLGRCRIQIAAFRVGLTGVVLNLGQPLADPVAGCARSMELVDLPADGIADLLLGGLGPQARHLA